MSGKAGGKGGPAKNPKKMKREPDDYDDNDFLDDLVVDTETDKRQPSYSTLEPGGFVTKGTDRKTRLDQRQVKIAAAAGEAEDDKQETKHEKLERGAGELTSQLKKVEGAEAQAREKDEKDKTKCYSQWITSGKFLKQPQP